ncbi:putative killer toxin alpha beta protein [Copromyces sp. CBS 386.78]|nr:putative killer toxin alpha beta protein [Copromyces sp. CBS 386.78]
MPTGNVNRQWKKEGSNMMVYNNTEWVAWMDDDTKAARAAFYDSYNFAGTTDWAVDLQEFVDDSSIVDDVQEGYTDPNYWSPCTGTYTTIDQLESHKGSIPRHCMDKYIVDVQIAVMEGALNKYKNLIDNGYDKKFSIYEKYVKAQIPDQINNFMASEKVDKYFKCKEYKYVTCCSSCTYACVCERGCTKSGYQLRDMDQCPKFEFTVVGFGNTDIPNATFTLTDPKGFYEDISKTWGIEQSWITYDRRHMRTNNGCQYAGENYNYLKPSNKVKIYNPKKAVGDSYPKAKDMLDRFKIVQKFSYYDELFQVADVVDATSLPAFTTAEAVESMGKIVEKADEIKKKERESFILNFITGLLFWIPMVGEFVGPELATLGRILRLIGENPQNVLGAIFGFLGAAGVGSKGFKDAAGKRRQLTGTKEYDALGDVKTQLDGIEAIRGVCRR